MQATDMGKYEQSPATAVPGTPQLVNDLWRLGLIRWARVRLRRKVSISRRLSAAAYSSMGREDVGGKTSVQQPCGHP